MVIANELGWCPEKRAVGRPFSCVSCGDFRRRLCFSLLLVPGGREAIKGTMFVRAAPVAEPMCCAIGFACRSLLVSLGSAARGDVFGTPGGDAQIHWIPAVRGRHVNCGVVVGCKLAVGLTGGLLVFFLK
jgi:hypothetical protein